MKRLFFLVLCTLLFAHPSFCEEIVIPRDSVPADHLSWFSLRGAVKEVVEYDYKDYGKIIWRFDSIGRLTEYMEYTHPFFENGGCVFGLWAHYRYAYDENGKIIFEETYNADYNTVDDFADLTLELFPPQRKEVDFRPKAEPEYGDTTSCYSVWNQKGEMSYYFGIRYDKHGNWFEEVYTSEDGYSCAAVRVREITYYQEISPDSLVGVADSIPQEEFWSSVPVGELKTLPAEVNEKDAFYLCFDYMGYAFEGSLYPLHNGWWIVLSHWCMDEEETMYLSEEDENGEPIPAASRYKDPFAGMRYPIIKTDSIGFMTRNYGNETIKLYKESEGKKVWDKLPVQCSMEVLDANPKTRRLLCRTNPSDWNWEENPQYYSVYGWIDEEWVCANLLTTCP